MKLKPTVRGRSENSERKWPIRPLRIASRPLNRCDHEYSPVTVQPASSARLSAKVVPLRLAAEPQTCRRHFLLADVFMTSSPLHPGINGSETGILPIDTRYDIYSPYEFGRA